MEKFTEIFFAVSAFAEAAVVVFYFVKILKDVFGADFTRGKMRPVEFCRKIFPAGFIAFSVMQLSFGIFNSLTCLISPLLIGKEPAAASAAMMLFNIFSLGASCIFYEIILRTAVYNNVRPYAENGGLTAVSLYLFAVGLYVNFSVFGNTVDSERIWEIFRNGVPMLAVHCFGAAAVYAAARTRKRAAEISFGAELSRKQAEQAAERLKKTAAFRHDAKRHIAVLSGLLKKDGKEYAEKYLSEIGSMAEGLSKSFNTGCAAADTVLESAFLNCEKFGIRAEFDLRFRENIMCTAELCGVLSNILDNAINACRCLDDSAEKFIRLRGGTQGNLLMLESENSFDGRPYKKGVGLMSIESTAKKYGGKVSVKSSGEVFFITVIMRF